MTKERRTVTLDPDVDEFLQKEGVNASELVNRLVEAHFTMGGDKLAMLEMREKQIESDIEELQARVESKEHELDQVQEQLSHLRNDKECVIQEAADVIPDEITSEQNGAVRRYADEAGISPSELLERIDDYRQ